MGEKIDHDECIPAEYKLRTHREPDRVYGLQKTRRLARLLDDTSTPSGHIIGQTLRSSPFPSRSEQIIFPFMVLEAKSEKSQNSRSATQAQTACAIITFLQLQSKLTKAARDVCPDTRASLSQPLVWFLTHKGEQWSISAAFLDI